MRQRTIKSVKACCDRLWSQLVKVNAGSQCEHCHRVTVPDTHDMLRLESHHVYGRTNHRLRFEPRNGCALCFTCHRWAEEHTLDFADWFRSVRGKDATWLQAENTKGPLKRNLHDYLALEADLKAQLVTLAEAA